VSVPARSRETVALTLERAGAGSSGLPTVYFWTGAALTLATLAGAVGAGSFALAQADRLRPVVLDPARQWLPGTAQDVDSMRAAALAADVLYGVAGALGVGSVVLFLLSDWRASRGREAPRPSARLLPALAPGAAGLGVCGVF
jgi:hypothetical protein